MTVIRGQPPGKNGLYGVDPSWSMVTQPEEKTVHSRYWYFDKGKYGVGSEELPPLAEDCFRVRTTRTLVSIGTEVSCNTGKPRWNQGRHGYSHAGVVVEVGRAVQGVAVGERIAGAKNHGEYATYQAGPKPELFVKIPPEVSDSEAVFLTLGTVALHVVERADLSVGQAAVVVGQGTVGQLTQQLARLAGAGLVVAVDLDEARLALSKSLGADAAIRPEAEALVAALSGAARGSAAPAFLEVSGSVRALGWILEVAPLRSRVALAGNYIESLSINPLKIVEGELDIVGAHQPKNTAEAHPFYPYNRRFAWGYLLDCLRSKRLKVTRLSDGEIGPDDLLAFYDAAREGRPPLRQPLIRWD